MTHSVDKTPLSKWLISLAAISGLMLVILIALGVIGGETKTLPGITPLTLQQTPDASQIYKISGQRTTDIQLWQGVLRSRLSVKLAPKVNARIISIPVHPGDRVKKGGVLVKLDDRELQAAHAAANAAVAAMQAQLQEARQEAKRITELYNKQAATRQNYDAVISKAKAVEAQVQQAGSMAQQSQVLLAEDTLYAPFDGIVGERLQEPGDMAVPNQAVLSFYQPDDLRLEVAVADECANTLRKDMPVQVAVNGQVINGMVDEISPEIDALTHSQQVKVRLPQNSSLQQGQFAALQLACHQDQTTIQIPVSAVINFGQLQAVKLIDGQAVYYRHIRTGKQLGDQIQVLSGLHPGETILLKGGLTQ